MMHSRTSFWLSMASLLGLSSGIVAGCGATSESTNAPVQTNVGSTDDDITQVSHSGVKKQAVGNCWIYAASSWIEALHKGATGREANTSESWLTYWHWFEQIASGRAGDAIQTGGFFSTAVGLIERYGLVKEGDFIPAEETAERSKRQELALKAINASLKSGVLSNPAARCDSRLVCRELDSAWALDAGVVQRMNAVFGDNTSRTLLSSAVSQSAAGSNKVVLPKDVPVRLKDPMSRADVTVTLQDALGTGNGQWSPRAGKYAWNELDYPYNSTQRRAFWKRVQRALHDELPVVITWFVDFNALTPNATLSLDALNARGPGRQGGHMTVLHDYQAEVPGLGLLKAGVIATPEQKEKALADGTKIQFVRVKNSWGLGRPASSPDAGAPPVPGNVGIPGYHDLEMAYLNGPIAECELDDKGNTDPTRCNDRITPMFGVVLPAGY